MVIQDGSESLTVPLELAGCMVHFKHRIPTSDEVGSLNQHCLSQGETPWNPSSFSDQVINKFYQQVISHEKYNVNLNSKLNPSSESDSETVRKHPPQSTFFDPSDAIGNMLKGKSAYLIFHTDTLHQASVSNVMSITTDPHLSRALPGKIDYERLSPYISFRQHDVIQHTLRQTTQLAKITIHYSMRRHLKVVSKC